MNRNTAYLVIGALAVVAVAVFGYQYYRERQNTVGVEIKIGDNGVSITKQ